MRRKGKDILGPVRDTLGETNRLLRELVLSSERLKEIVKAHGPVPEKGGAEDDEKEIVARICSPRPLVLLLDVFRVAEEGEVVRYVYSLSYRRGRKNPFEERSSRCYGEVIIAQSKHTEQCGSREACTYVTGLSSCIASKLPASKSLRRG